MKKFLFLLILVSILFISCDGKDRVHTSSSEALKEHKLLDSFSEKIEYIPENYTEFSTDTILSNGFIVKIKTYTDLNNNVLKKFNSDTLTHKILYRQFISEVVITKKGNEIFNKKIDFNYLSKLNANINKYKDDYIFNNLELNQFESLKKNEVSLILSFCNPGSVNCPAYNLIIKRNGNVNINKID